MQPNSGPEKHGATFVDVSLRGARFTRVDLSDAVMRGVDVAGADIDAPWLLDGESSLHVNGVDVAPLVEAELNRRFPGRAERRAETPDGLRHAWAAVERTWAATLERVAAMPEDATEVSVSGEWSFGQTLRHLVMATDTWLGAAVLQRDQPYHPMGLPNVEYVADGHDPSVFSPETPGHAAVLAVREQRLAMVREFLAKVTAEDLRAPRKNPWSPQHPETVLSCLHTILEEEWEHHRYAVRDLEVVAAAAEESPRDEVVLLDEQRRPTGTAPRASVHTTATPLHLAFSCYLYDSQGRILLTRRALTKRTWPGVWTNSFCGHPRPGETLVDAVRRHGRHELGVDVVDVEPLLPDFRYRAVDASGTVENEVCPVFVARTPDPPAPHPDEVVEMRWLTPADLQAAATTAPWALSPWTTEQLAQIGRLPDIGTPG